MVRSFTWSLGIRFRLQVDMHLQKTIFAAYKETMQESEIDIIGNMRGLVGPLLEGGYYILKIIDTYLDQKIEKLEKYLPTVL